jgi:hypothetical protein
VVPVFFTRGRSLKGDLGNNAFYIVKDGLRVMFVENLKGIFHTRRRVRVIPIHRKLPELVLQLLKIVANIRFKICHYTY